MNDMVAPLWLKLYTYFTLHLELEYNLQMFNIRRINCSLHFKYLNYVTAHDIKYKNSNMLITYCSLGKECLEKYLCFYMNNYNIRTAMRNDSLLYTTFTAIAVGILLIPIGIRFMCAVVIDDISVVVRTGYCDGIRHCC